VRVVDAHRSGTAVGAGDDEVLKMCGIGGFFGKARPDAEELVGRLSAKLAHRGPDDEGMESFAPRMDSRKIVSLVHRRLSIIDLSSLGHQPMRDNETGNWIVYNGETYNYRELGLELQAKGVALASQSDTEVLLKLYRLEGRKFLNRLQGMFALALWDDAEGELMLAVDPIGIKPLYYWADGGNVLFASEVRALLATGLIRRNLDVAGLEGYLSYGAVQAPHTAVSGVLALLPGTYVVVRSDCRIDGPHAYWRPQFCPADGPPHDRKKLVGEVREILATVVRQHLVSDVPLGVFLSGGIDSSAIAALMSSAQRDSVHTFSVIFAEKEFSEAEYSRDIARRYSAQHTEVCLSEGDLLGMLPDSLRAMDQPTADGTNVYVVSQAVREAGVKAALSGQGGDELFGGYTTFRAGRRAKRWGPAVSAVPAALRREVARQWSMVAGRRIVPHKASQFLESPGDGLSTYCLLRQLYPESTRRALFPAGASARTRDGLPLHIHEELREHAGALDVVNGVSLFELRTYLANMLLRDGDFMSMAHGLEVRVPFLDKRIVEYMAGIPGRQKLAWRMNKPLLVRAMGELLPPAIHRRPKQGFNLPFEHWFRNELRPRLAATFEDDEQLRFAGLEPLVVRRIWDSFLSKRGAITAYRVWSLFVVTAWCRQHAVGIE
jgi:asparagine synthase (glutamine-hydrolysing)